MWRKGKLEFAYSLQKASDLYWKTATVSVEELRMTNVKRENALVEATTLLRPFQYSVLGLKGEDLMSS